MKARYSLCTVTSVSLVVEPATHLVVTTRSTSRSVTAAAHSVGLRPTKRRREPNTL